MAFVNNFVPSYDTADILSIAFAVVLNVGATPPGNLNSGSNVIVPAPPTSWVISILITCPALRFVVAICVAVDCAVNLNVLLESKSNDAVLEAIVTVLTSL